MSTTTMPTFDQMSASASQPNIKTDWQVYPSDCGTRIAYANSQPTNAGRANFNLAEGTATITGVGLDATGKTYITLTYADRALDLTVRVADVARLIDALDKVQRSKLASQR